MYAVAIWLLCIVDSFRYRLHQVYVYDLHTKQWPGAPASPHQPSTEKWWTRDAGPTCSECLRPSGTSCQRLTHATIHFNVCPGLNQWAMAARLSHSMHQKHVKTYNNCIRYKSPIITLQIELSLEIHWRCHGLRLQPKNKFSNHASQSRTRLTWTLDLRHDLPNLRSTPSTN